MAITAMAGVDQLERTATEADLKQLLSTQKTAAEQERIQWLYRLKTKQATTIQSAAALLGRHRVTLRAWWSSSKAHLNPAVGDSRAFPSGHRRHSTSVYTQVRATATEVVVRESTQPQCPLQNRASVGAFTDSQPRPKSLVL